MIESDIEDYVRWFTSDTEWGNWDAPWESYLSNDEKKERKEWTDYYNYEKNYIFNNNYFCFIMYLFWKYLLLHK